MNTRAERLQGEGAVHGSGLKVEQAKMPGQVAGNGAFARSGWSVNCNDYSFRWFERAQRILFHAHPRFLVPCLGLAVKPNRLLLPAFAPAASIGFRLLAPLRAGRASVRASLRASLRIGLPLWVEALDLLTGLEPLEWPLCWPHDGVDAFAVRPLAVRPFAARPFPALPFKEPLVAWLPLPLPFPLERCPLPLLAP
jgi:hypothetical protein